MGKIALIIPPKNFRDAEYFKSKKIIEQAGIKTVTASKIVAKISGADGETASANCSVSDIRPTEYDGVVFVGGPGASEIVNDSEYVNLAKAFFDAGKLVAAICIAPAIFADAQIIKGKKVTAWDGIKNNLKVAGANFTGEKVEVDGNIVTGSGPEAAEDFGKAIADYILNKSI